MRRVALVSVLSGSLVAAQALLVNEAHAGGFELSGVGTRGLGRAGANAASVDDSLALALNPALLADIDSQVVLNVHLAVWDACVQRSGSYGNSAADYAGGATIFGDDGNFSPSPYAGTAFPRVCNSGMPQAIPQIMANVRLTEELGLGFGIVAPNGVGTARFGGEDGTMRVNGQLVPTPTRYMVTAQDLLLFYPSIGVGYRPFEWLRVGLTLQWGIGIISFTNYVNSGTYPAGAPGTLPEDPSADVRARLNVQDWFVPAGILSLHFTPIDNLDIMVSGRISDSIGGVVAASGNIEATTGVYGTGSDVSYVPTRNVIEGATLEAGQPFQFTLGARYADRVRRRGEEGHHRADSLHDENWDVEFNLVYEQLSQVQDFVIGTPPGTMARLQQGGGAAALGVPLPNPIPLPHGWSDLLTMRLGGDVNVIPDQLAIRAGVSFEQPLDQRYRRYLSSDFIGGWRFGAHAGATLRVDSFDISLAYGFFLGETVTNNDVAGVRSVNATAPQTPVCDGGGRPVAQSGCYPQGFGTGIVNAGTFSQMFHAVSLGASYHFN